MESLFQFALALLSAGAPWLAAIIVVAIAIAVVAKAMSHILPIRLNLSIGDHSSLPDSAVLQSIARSKSVHTLDANTSNTAIAGTMHQMRDDGCK